MSGGGTTQTTSSSPWSGQQPYLQDIFRQAQSWYNNGGSQFGDQTQQAMDMMFQRGLTGDPSQTALGNYVTDTLNQPMVDPNQAYNMYGQVGAAAPGLDASQGYAGLPETGAAATAGLNTLGATASGDFLGANPYLDDLYDTGSQQIMDQFNQEIMPSLNATFGSAGRTGGGTHQLVAGEAAGDTADALAGLYGNIYAPAYEAERDRMMQAGSQLQQGDIQRRGLATDLYGTGVGAQLGAAGGMNDIYGTMGDQAFRAGSLQPTYTAQQYQDLDRMLGVGNMIDQEPYNNLANYASLIYGLPGGYGTTTSTGPSGSPLGSAAGGALTGLSLGGPIGAGIGGVAGLLAGFL